MSSELLNEFIFDARGHLGVAGGQLLELEKDPGSLTALNALMGTLHTIKGNSGFLDLQNLYSLMHRSESLLQTVREVAGLICPSKVIDQLFQVLDTAEAVLDRLENGDDDMVDWMDALNQALGEAEAALDKEAQSSSAGAARNHAAAASAPVRETAAKSAAPVHIKEDLSGQVRCSVLENGIIKDDSERFIAVTEAMFQAGLKGFVIDMRRIDSFSRIELTTLVKLQKQWGDGLALVLDGDKQDALYRVFQILNLDKTFRFFPDEKKAAASFLSS